MFRQIVRSTPLTDEIADEVFPRIKGYPYNGDVTFLATLRALLAPRIGQTDTVQLVFGSSSYSTRNFEGARDGSIMNALGGSYVDVPGIIYVHNSQKSSGDSCNAGIEWVEKNFLRVNSGYQRLELVTEFYRKIFNVVCFVNIEKKSVFLYVENMTIATMHYLQCGILAYVPWYFNKEQGITQLEKDLIESLRMKTPEAYNNIILEFAKVFDFKSLRIRKMLGGFETATQKTECRRIKDSIVEVIEELNRYDRRIAELLQKKYDFEVNLLGLEAKIAEMEENGDSEIMEYFLSNPHIVLERCSGSSVTFGTKTYLEYFDEDMAKSLIDNDKSYIYRTNNNTSGIKDKDMKKLMYAIFIDQTMKIRMCSSYTINIMGGVSPNSHWDYSYEYNGYTPNPHIDRYACLGNYSRAITEMLKRRDYIGAIEQCVASCRSLNFGDSPVMSEFMARLYGLGEDRVNIVCIELPDGRVVEPKAAIKYIIDQEKAQEEAKEQEESANE